MSFKMKKKSFALVCVLLLFVNTTGQTDKELFKSSVGVEDIPGFTITKSAGCDSNYIFLATTTTAVTPYIMIINNNGEPLFARQAKGGVYDFKPQPNGMLSYYDFKSDCYFILDKDYNLIDSLQCLNGVETDIHELRILSNGNYLILGYDSHTVDMSKIVEGGNTSAIIIGYVLQEMDKNKNLVFEWRTWDHFDITDSYSDLKQGTIDVSHGNSIDVDFDGNFLVSFRNTQEVTKINRVTGEIMWRLGGKKNRFEFINDTLGFSWQHAARRLQNGNIMLFDNGFKREPSVMAFSRALEYKIDENNFTAGLVWQYRNKPDIYSIGLGYSQKLPNNNTFIAWGAAIPAITEVTESGNEVFELSFKGNYFTYRAYRFPWGVKQIENGTPVYSRTDKCNFKLENNNDTISVNISLVNPNTFPAVITSVTNKERLFYIPYEFPASIGANDSLSFRVYFRPDLSGSYIDTLKIVTNINNIYIPLIGEEVTNNVNQNNFRKEDFKLYQSYPNPFNMGNKIEFRLSQRSFVKLQVFDVLGKMVSELVNEEKETGLHSVLFSGINNSGSVLPSGIYFYSLNVNGRVQSKKMILEK